MIEGSCHCGKVRIAVETAPTEVTSCNCSICRRGGTLWAYYSPKTVRIDEAVPTDTYVWDDRLLTSIAARIAAASPIGARRSRHDRMGINTRLCAARAVLAAARVRHFDGASRRRQSRTELGDER